MSEEVRVEQRDGWRKLVLNRPEKLNAANEAMLTALLAALDEAEADRALPRAAADRRGARLLRRAGTGADGDAGPDGPPDLGSGRRRCITGSCGGCATVPLPVVCAVNGVAAGAGASYRAGLRHRAGGAQREVHPGVREDRPGARFRRQLLPAAPGRRGARARAGDAGRAGRMPAQAEAWGMIWKVVDDAALQAEAEALTAHLATQPTEALARDEAHVRRFADQHAGRAARSRARAAGRRPGAAPTMPRACARSWRSARRVSRDADDGRRRAGPRLRRCDVGGRPCQRRARHAPGRCRAGPRAAVDDGRARRW